MPESVSGWTIQHEDPEAYNDENNRDNVTIQEVSVPVTNGSLEVKPYSVTMITVPAGK